VTPILPAQKMGNFRCAEKYFGKISSGKRCEIRGCYLEIFPGIFPTGSGILLLTAVEMADLSLKPENKSKTFVLNAMDVSPEGLAGLMNYLRAQVLKLAEKKLCYYEKFMLTEKTLSKIVRSSISIF